MADIPIQVDLSQIKNDLPDQRRKKGQIKNYSEEDKFMMTNIQPESKSRFTTNSF